MQEAEKIWMNGELVDWPDARVHVLSHGLHYGTTVFEGIRSYDAEGGVAVFRLDDHLARLERSAAMYHMPLPFGRDEMRTAVHQVISANGLGGCYIRPIVLRGYGTMGLFPLEAPVDVAVAAWQWGAYLGEDGLRDGIRAKISSWRRIGSTTIPATAKAGGQYLNSILAKIETHKAGYQEAILLNEAGYVADGSGENLFLVRDGVLITPPATRASPSSSARSPAASCTPPTRSSSPAPRPRSARSTRSTTTPWGWGRSRSASRPGSSPPRRGATRARPSGSTTWAPRRRPSDGRARPHLRHHAARRDAA
jgi:branched-chain amino acid aminotransferase group I